MKNQINRFHRFCCRSKLTFDISLKYEYYSINLLLHCDQQMMMHSNTKSDTTKVFYFIREPQLNSYIITYIILLSIC